jgi:hypothetical protein
LRKLKDCTRNLISPERDSWWWNSFIHEIYISIHISFNLASYQFFTRSTKIRTHSYMKPCWTYKAIDLIRSLFNIFS